MKPLKRRHKHWLGAPSRLRRSLLGRRLHRCRIPSSLWLRIERADPLSARFNARARVGLRILASEIRARKRFSAARDMALTEAMSVSLAMRIAIMIFALEKTLHKPTLAWLRNWHEIIVYPGAFTPHREPIERMGGSGQGLVLHTEPVELGETSYQGALVISWETIRSAIAPRVLFHELAHKLDMLDGYSNGHPPLHASMDHQLWHDTFTAAFLDLQHQLDAGHKPRLDPYAATSPAEFFAVCSEYFFTRPERLHAACPQVYRQLCLFYRQQPLDS